MDDEIARLRAEADWLLAEARRMHAEAERRRIAASAQADQAIAQARDIMARTRRLLGPAPARSRPRAPRDRSQWITRQILAALEAEAPLPVSTTRLVGKLGLQHEYPTVLRVLNRLAKAGEVEKWPAVERRCCYWRRLGDGGGTP
jgi:hypothetical protein